MSRPSWRALYFEERAKVDALTTALVALKRRELGVAQPGGEPVVREAARGLTTTANVEKLADRLRSENPALSAEDASRAARDALASFIGG